MVRQWGNLIIGALDAMSKGVRARGWGRGPHCWDARTSGQEVGRAFRKPAGGRWVGLSSANVGTEAWVCFASCFPDQERGDAKPVDLDSESPCPSFSPLLLPWATFVPTLLPG